MKKGAHIPPWVFGAIVTIVAGGLALLHVAKPSLKVDSVTVALVVIGALPWLYRFVQSVELPGGFKVSLRALEQAGEKVTSAAPGVISSMAASGNAAESQSTMQRVYSLDPNLAVAHLRIEIEKLARQIADEHGIANRGPLTSLLRILGTRGVIPSQTVIGLEELVQLGNMAVHGGTLEPDTARWAVDVGPHILEALTEYLS